MPLEIANRFPDNRAAPADRSLTQRLHDASQSRVTGRAGRHDRDGLLDVDAVSRVKLVQTVEQCLSALLQFGGQFEHEDRSDGGVLVAAVVSRHETDRFLRGEDEAVRSVDVDLTRDVLEADEHVAHDFDSIVPADGRDERCRDERFDDEVVGCQRTVRRAMAQHVVGQQRAELVSRQTDELAGSVSHGDRHPIGVGVRREDQFGTRLFGVSDGGREDIGPLRIRQMIVDVGERAVHRSLRLENGDILETELPHDAIDRRFTDTVQRRVERANASRWREALQTDGLRIRAVHVVIEQPDPAIIHRRVEVHRRYLSGGIDAGDDSRIVRRQHLASRGPVGLEAIVGRRIV